MAALTSTNDRSMPLHPKPQTLHPKPRPSNPQNLRSKPYAPYPNELRSIMAAFTSNNDRCLWDLGVGVWRWAVWASGSGVWGSGLGKEGLGLRVIKAVLTFNNHRSRCTSPGLRVWGWGVEV